MDIKTAWESIPKLIAQILSRGLGRLKEGITGADIATDKVVISNPVECLEQNGLDIHTAWESIPKLIAKILSRGLGRLKEGIAGADIRTLLCPTEST
ncbi:hypothetical protein [Lyngbya sp. CCY1209]|uniref:hypothetical protein n=1 Tax=Lyngbya sp. CCY1209 TaxID=2886103 RepID=UPI002D20FA4A|nr:hypothetical protein [Lyngbya sp. CCY1209]MEB3885225.1 hypothetical protein [Lyngbya sp. CCY1209]